MTCSNYTRSVHLTQTRKVYHESHISLVSNFLLFPLLTSHSLCLLLRLSSQWLNSLSLPRCLHLHLPSLHNVVLVRQQRRLQALVALLWLPKVLPPSILDLITVLPSKQPLIPLPAARESLSLLLVPSVLLHSPSEVERPLRDVEQSMSLTELDEEVSRSSIPTGPIFLTCKDHSTPPPVYLKC